MMVKRRAGRGDKKKNEKENGGNGRKKGTGCIHRRTGEEVHRKPE